MPGFEDLALGISTHNTYWSCGSLIRVLYCIIEYCDLERVVDVVERRFPGVVTFVFLKSDWRGLKVEVWKNCWARLS